MLICWFYLSVAIITLLTLQSQLPVNLLEQSILFILEKKPILHPARPFLWGTFVVHAQVNFLFTIFWTMSYLMSISLLSSIFFFVSYFQQLLLFTHASIQMPNIDYGNHYISETFLVFYPKPSRNAKQRVAYVIMRGFMITRKEYFTHNNSTE